MRIALLWCTRMRLLDHNSSTLVFPPNWAKCRTRAPPLYAELMNSRLPGPQTGVLMLSPHDVLWGRLQSSSPLFGSSPTTSSLDVVTSCSCPSTLIRIGEEGAFEKFWFCQTSDPSLGFSATMACPCSPSLTMMVFL